MSESSFAYDIHSAAAAPSMKETSSAFRRVASSLGHRAATRPIFVLLLATVFAHFWFASAPLPAGGPNVILGAVTVLLSLIHILGRVARAESLSAVIPDFLSQFRPILPIAAVCFGLLAWATVVYVIFSDVVASALLAQIALGIGILFAAFVSVDSIYRAVLVAMAIVLAAFVSALFGAAVVFIGDPFLSIWVNISTIEDHYLRTVLVDGRAAGLAPDTNALGYQLTAAVPIAFAALLYRPFESSRAAQMAFDVVLFLMLATMTTVVFVNFTRSVIVGVGFAAVAVALPAVRSPWILRRILVIVPPIAVWILVFFNVDTITDAIAASDSDVAAPVSTPVSGSDVAIPAAPSRSYVAVPAPGNSPDDGGSPTIFDPAPNPEGIPVEGLQRLGGTVEYLYPGGEFEVEIRTLSDQGVMDIGGVFHESHDEDGNFVLAWPEPRDIPSIIAYQGRTRHETREEGFWNTWLSLAPLDTAVSHDIRGLYVVTHGHTNPYLPGVVKMRDSLVNNTNDAFIGHTFEHLVAWWHYSVQIRAWNGTEWLTSGVVSAAPGEDRTFLLRWEKPRDPNITEYQFRLLWNNETQWRGWIPFVPHVQSSKEPEPDTNDEEELMARMALYHFTIIGGTSRESPWEFTDKSTRARIPMTFAALQYSLDNPLGTGVYSPDRSHLIRGISPWMEHHVLTEPPHNQFLNALVYYGFPGLTLLIFFYAFVIRSLVHSGRFVISSGGAALYFLGAAAVGALLAHGINGLARNAGGPFEGDWGYFFVLALVFALHKIVDSRAARSGSPQP